MPAALTIDSDVLAARLGMPPGDTPGEVVRRCFIALTELDKNYGPAYRAMNHALADARAGTGPFTVEEVERQRTALVLAVTGTRQRVQGLVNEHVPGTFPTEEQPTGSGDPDEYWDWIIGFGLGLGGPEGAVIAVLGMLGKYIFSSL
jgi:hypothetical protein